MNTDNIYDGVEFDPNDLESLRKEYERIRNRDAIIAMLQAEVRAWRDWDDNCGVELHPDNIEACSCEGVNRVENVLNAKKATDTLGALNEENKR